MDNPQFMEVLMGNTYKSRRIHDDSWYYRTIHTAASNFFPRISSDHSKEPSSRPGSHPSTPSTDAASAVALFHPEHRPRRFTNKKTWAKMKPATSLELLHPLKAMVLLCQLLRQTLLLTIQLLLLSSLPGSSWLVRHVEACNRNIPQNKKGNPKSYKMEKATCLYI